MSTPHNAQSIACAAAELERALGAELLVRLTGDPPAPDERAARLRYLYEVVDYLSGTYDERGVRRWLGRRRAQLGGRAPTDLLIGGWAPEDEGPEEVRRLAASLIHGQGA
jgi:hypothetical protein